MHCGARPCLFFVFDFARRRRTLNLRRIAAGAATGVRRATRSAVSLQLRAISCRSCALQDVMRLHEAQLAFSLCGLLGFVQVVLSQHGHRLQPF